MKPKSLFERFYDWVGKILFDGKPTATLLILLLPFLTSAQDHISFYAGSQKTLGAEVLIHVRDTDSFSIGGGFSGMTNPDRSADNEKWCSLYGTTSFGYIGSVLVKYKAGMYTLTSDNARQVDYKPLIGIGAMYGITKDFGLEIGIDNFNKLTAGFCIIF